MNKPYTVTKSGGRTIYQRTAPTPRLMSKAPGKSATVASVVQQVKDLTYQVKLSRALAKLQAALDELAREERAEKLRWLREHGLIDNENWRGL